MAKKKSKRIEKETRKVIEAYSDIIKLKKDKYKFKAGKKKEINRMKKSCLHWIIRKGEERPATEPDSNNPHNWKCGICNKSFPIKPKSFEEYLEVASAFEADVNQLAFYAVKMGATPEDIKILLNFKKSIPEFIKMSRNLTKALNKRQEYEDRKRNSDLGSSQFSDYGSFSYNNK